MWWINLFCFCRSVGSVGGFDDGRGAGFRLGGGGDCGVFVGVGSVVGASFDGGLVVVMLVVVLVVVVIMEVVMVVLLVVVVVMVVVVMVGLVVVVLVVVVL